VLQNAPAGRIIPFEMSPLAISASLVRERIRAGRSARYLLPDSVLDYIGLHHLYRRN
jgi:nicotinate-nucleotide adenylyltransferase